MVSGAFLENEFNFNSHTREGVTLFNNLRPLEPAHFNSHTREGVTNIPVGKQTKNNFNSHTREGVT